jgi:hypothetical protein
MTLARGKVESAPRRSGWWRLDDRSGARPSDHACVSYASDAERSDAVASWLIDGVGIGQRAMYVGDGTVDELCGHLHGFPDLESAVESGRLVVASASHLYDIGTPIQPDSQLAMYDAAVSRAIADGYQGLRVAADITPLVINEGLRASHLHWEQVADRYITGHPLAPLCMYDTRRIPSLAAIAAAHPLQGPTEPVFVVFGLAPAAAAMEGEVDACVADVLADVLRGLPTTDRRLDIERVAFVDARSAAVIHDEVQRRYATGNPLMLTGASRAFKRVWELCRFDPGYLSA